MMAVTLFPTFFSAILYLNGDFEGGAFYFTELDAKTQTVSNCAPWSSTHSCQALFHPWGKCFVSVHGVNVGLGLALPVSQWCSRVFSRRQRCSPSVAVPWASPLAQRTPMG